MDDGSKKSNSVYEFFSYLNPRTKKQPAAHEETQVFFPNYSLIAATAAGMCQQPARWTPAMPNIEVTTGFFH